ncbi:phosphoenolpyruvate--protein phosphotransferase [Amphiplicatus metriothermophilus]|uniref:phosphoenolpyruvate--protein phosphotransferase n=1 Tax=Amphiplicatus metriothermophilus TaxID=1519374 RepID=A0A239PT40_9PROT|nr:phosphoenolpyruvate--protein phosphotransferase [Amphiplicatus metriothermophilus]MBB5519143.1 phosphotransferase system enzyme I (PtsP) [Amphiplicatus metriothermophilus]SNT73213.1 phosphotransferase system, enzyme I, PtsP [Amphiplicatus metriothermophilus]
MSLEYTRPPYGGHGERGITVLLRRMHDAVAEEATAQERLDKLTRIIASHIVADVCSIYLRRPDDRLELYSTEGLNRAAVHQTVLGWGEGLVGLVAATQRPLVTAEAPLHPAFAYRPETGEDPLHSFLGVPLIRSGKVLGVLVLQNKASRRYTDDEVEAAQALAILLAEVAASGELLGKEETAAVGEMLHQPDRLQGVGVAPGVAMGKAAFHEPPPAQHKVFATDVAREAQRLEDGLAALRASVDGMLADESLAGVSREVLETYRLFAYDRGWKERLRAAVFSGLTAEAAVEQVKAENRARLSQARDPYLRERLHDLDDLAHRLLRHLSGGGANGRRPIPDQAIVIARAMGPADLLEYDRAKLKGLVLAEASETSHVAIVARALEIPLVAGVDDALERAFEGDDVVIDGETGEVHIRPGPDVVQSLREKQELQSERQAAFAQERALPGETRDGVRIEIFMNAGLALDMPHLDATGAAGVGLFRTELQFLIGSQLPKVEAQERLYRDVLERAGGKPVVFRTADLGGDKAAAYMKRRVEGNPAMGWRGLRMAVDRPGILRPQLRALLAAAAGRELFVMFPMVTLPAEIDAARALLDREIARRERRGKPLPASIRIGAMIETPAAAWRLEEIAEKVDFLSVGGNDLAQFYFAADRDSDMVQERFDPLEPGFLTFLRMVIDKAYRAGKPLSYCGEQAADPLMAAALIGLGVRRFSIPATSVGPFRRLVRAIEAGAVAGWLKDRLEGGAPDGVSLRDGLAALLADQGVQIQRAR